ncbi:glycosyltransferase family 9 protein [Mesonia sp. MT50]|uniref:Glycosyltransferase family 9 protein n=1 Tax=Mesonia profundi TaxID=3070998 RepID=A0ABU0ZYS0_9FLAO|nr:glycosyltransferase family 9 protein [Mesonia profundi]MDQ7916557.1 glycosyltransferase family 9 protein [Mesonia profundi]
MKNSTQHIAIIRLSALGDVAMLVPVLRRLLQQYPDLKVTVVTKPFFGKLFQDLPQVNVLVAEVKTEHKGIMGLWSLAKEIKALDVDAVADVHDVLRSKMLRFFFFLYGIKSASIDKGRAEKKALTQLAPKTITPLKTTQQRYAAVFEQLGFPIDLDQEISFEKPQLPKQFQEYIGQNVKKWIGIAPFAAHETKMYPLDLMEEVIVALNEENNLHIFLFGGGNQERQLLEPLAEKYENVSSLVGIFAFAEELHIIANLDLMISMDSGNGHMAAMYQVPVISIWGNTHPYAGFAPFQQTPAQQILPDLTQYPFLPTSIYGNKEVSGYEDVMKSIPPREIIEKAKSYL